MVLQHRLRAAAITVTALSAPPNPAFDVAGLLAGAMGVPLWMFLTAVFLGRIASCASALCNTITDNDIATDGVTGTEVDDRSLTLNDIAVNDAALGGTNA